MSELIDLMRPFWLQGLNGIAGRLHTGFTTHLMEGEYQIYNDVGEGVIQLRYPEMKKVLNAIGYDCNKLSMAAFESMISAVPDSHSEKAISWLLIRTYYSAFFAANAILRFIGKPIIHLNSLHIKKIMSIAKLYGVECPETWRPGIYTADIDTKHKVIVLLNISGTSTGQHDKYWKTFANEIKCIVNKALASNEFENYQNEILELDNFRKALQRPGTYSASNWLSAIRNEINYQQLRGVWFPYGEKLVILRRITQLAKNWRNDPDTMIIPYCHDNEICEFVSLCTFIVSLCHGFVKDMSERSASGNSFLNYGARKFLNLYCS